MHAFCRAVVLTYVFACHVCRVSTTGQLPILVLWQAVQCTCRVPLLTPPCAAALVWVCGCTECGAITITKPASASVCSTSSSVQMTYRLSSANGVAIQGITANSTAATCTVSPATNGEPVVRVSAHPSIPDAHCVWHDGMLRYRSTVGQCPAVSYQAFQRLRQAVQVHASFAWGSFQGFGRRLGKGKRLDKAAPGCAVRLEAVTTSHMLYGLSRRAHVYVQGIVLSAGPALVTHLTLCCRDCCLCPPCALQCHRAAT